MLDHTKYEIQCYKEWVEVTEYVFRSWTGPRRLNGESYVGPVYLLGTDFLAKNKPKGVVA